MENKKIIKTVTDIFTGADERNWQKIKNVMAANVLLDYKSMTGENPVTQTPKQITEAWAAFLPGFDKTHHQLSDFRVTVKNNVANVNYFGKADHYLGKEIWTVEGTYNTELEKQNNNWLITKQKFNLTKQSGNTNLPAKATQN